MRFASRSLRLLRFACTLALPLAVAGCDSDSPTAPPQPARLEARGSLDFSCGLNCSYEGDAVNAGFGCARNVRGVTRLLRADGSELARDEWQLDAERRVDGGEGYLYRGCCFSLADVQAMASYDTSIFWDAAACN